MSANRFCKTRGVVLWNDQNVSERFLYDKNINLITNTPGVMRFDAQIVVDNLMNVLKEKNND